MKVRISRTIRYETTVDVPDRYDGFLPDWEGIDRWLSTHPREGGDAPRISRQVGDDEMEVVL